MCLSRTHIKSSNSCTRTFQELLHLYANFANKSQLWETIIKLLWIISLESIEFELHNDILLHPTHHNYSACDFEVFEVPLLDGLSPKIETCCMQVKDK